MRTKGSIQRRGANSWRIRYTDSDGIRHSETIKGDRGAAEGELLSRLTELSKGIPVSSRPNTVLFGALARDVMTDYEVNEFRTYDDIEARFRLHIIPAFGKKKAAQITTAQLKEYIVQRRTEGAANGTIKRELEAIRHTFKLAMQGRKLHHMPHVPMVKESAPRQGFFTAEEIERLASFLPAPLDSFIRLAFQTGWRLEELRGLRWANVDFVAGELRLDPGTTKSGEGRVYPMSAEARGLLEKLPRKGLFVFIRSGQPIGDFRKTWKTANFKAGLPCVLDTKGKPIRAVRIFHDIRRSAARDMVRRRGLSEREAMMLTGHKTRSVFDRYSVVSTADLEGIRRKLDASGPISGPTDMDGIRKLK